MIQRLLKSHLRHSIFIRPLPTAMRKSSNLPSQKLAPYLFDICPQRNPSSLNALLSTYNHAANANSVWLLFCQMHQTGSSLDSFTFTPVLSSCSAIANLHRGSQVHTLVNKFSSNSETVVGTALIDMYSKCGQLGDATLVFEEVKYKDIVTWNALLSGFVHCGFSGSALAVFDAMKKDGVEISEFTLSSMLKVCLSPSALRVGRQIHAMAVVRGWSSLVLSTALVGFYSGCGVIFDAFRVYYGFTRAKDNALHNAMVSGCIRNHKLNWAFFMARQMKANAIAFTSLLAACSELSNLAYGKQLHSVAIRQGFESDTLLCNALLDMYAKCGMVANARAVFDRIDAKNVVSWTTIIDAYGSHGHGVEAFRLFEEMEKNSNGLCPNSVTFLAVISACGHSGLVNDGQDCFVSMEKHGINPGPEHYACYIDLLCRAGRTREAWDVFDSMVMKGVELTGAVWAALLNACRGTLDVQRGEFAAKHLLELEPKKPENYILLSNFYAAVGNWDAVEELRRSMKEKGLKKEMGSSWVASEGKSSGLAVAINGGLSVYTAMEAKNCQ